MMSKGVKMKTKDDAQCLMRRICVSGGRTRMGDVGLRIVRYALLEEVGLALQRDHVHEVEGVGDVVYFVIAERDKQAIGNKLDILAHQSRVHANEFAWQSVCSRWSIYRKHCT